MRDQADAASAPAVLPPPPARLSALPQRKGEVKFSMYGLDLSDPKWAEVAERTAEAEAHFVPQEAKPVEGKAKKAEEKLLAVEPRKGDPLPAMEEWKEEHLPKRVDWMALLDRVKARNVELYLKVRFSTYMKSSVLYFSIASPVVLLRVVVTLLCSFTSFIAMVAICCAKMALQQLHALIVRSWVMRFSCLICLPCR
jgi:hypothetical protein